MRVERLRERLHSYVQAQAWDAAALTLARWRETYPQDFEPALHAASVLLTQKQYRAAFHVIDDAVRQLRCPPELLLETVLCLQQFAAANTLVQLCAQFDQADQLPAKTLARTASLLMHFGLGDQAEVLLRVALGKAPSDPLCLINQAFLLFYRDQPDAAAQVLEMLIGGTQDVAMAHWLLSRLRRQTPADHHVARLRERLSRIGLHEDDRAWLGFALFKELDDLGAHAEAWQSLIAANAVLAKRHPYQSTASTAKFARIRALFDGASVPPILPPSRPTPIFIVGMHRSGTSLLEHLLSASPAVLACGETQRLRAAIAYAMDAVDTHQDDAFLDVEPQRFDAALAAEHFFALTANVADEVRFVTEKWPLNFLHVGFIRQMFPDAKVIHLRRDPLDLCFANFRERFSDGTTHTHALADIAHFHQAYVELMAHWHRVYPGFVLDVDYEQLVQDPQAQMQRVCAFCDLDSAAMKGTVAPRQDFVATLSAAQVRQPIHNRSVGRHAPYQTQLAALVDLLKQGERGA